jgi:hypothetical protein
MMINKLNKDANPQNITTSMIGRGDQECTKAEYIPVFYAFGGLSMEDDRLPVLLYSSVSYSLTLAMFNACSIMVATLAAG